MYTLILLIAALLPAFILAIYIFIKDRAEKEPFLLLLKLLIFGVISCFPVMLVSTSLGEAIDLYFKDATTSVELYAYQFAQNFIGIALVEELFKFIFLFMGTAGNKHFNSLFDGVIYAVFVSLGFAAFENVLYVFDGGISVAILRALLSVPGHMFFGVLMGYYYSLWHIAGKARRLEKQYRKENLIPKRKLISRFGYLLMAVLVPILAHGAYDFCCSLNSMIILLAFIILELFLYIYCFKKIRTLSKYDQSTHDYAVLMLIQKYPEAKNLFN